MELTPSQLRTLIDYTKTHMIEATQLAEVLELKLEQQPYLKFRIDELLTRNSAVNERLRNRLYKLEVALQRDEAVNGWMGEDRIVDFAV